MEHRFTALPYSDDLPGVLVVVCDCGWFENTAVKNEVDGEIILDAGGNDGLRAAELYAQHILAISSSLT